MCYWYNNRSIEGSVTVRYDNFLTPLFPLSSPGEYWLWILWDWWLLTWMLKMDANSELYTFQYVMCMCADDVKQKTDYCSDQHVARPFLQGWTQASIYATSNWCFFFFFFSRWAFCPAVIIIRDHKSGPFSRGSPREPELPLTHTETRAAFITALHNLRFQDK